MTQLMPMALFALTMSISPGPVNILTLSTSINHGLTKSIPFVIGACIGFTCLLLGLGLSFQLVAGKLGSLLNVLAVLGAGLIVYFGYKLISSDGRIEAGAQTIPSFTQGALLQALNPKAWGACLAAISIFKLEDSRPELLAFVTLYFFMCLIGVGSWAVFGGPIRKLLNSTMRRQMFNRILGVTLILLALGLLSQNFLGK